MVASGSEQRNSDLRLYGSGFRSHGAYSSYGASKQEPQRLTLSYGRVCPYTLPTMI